MPEEKPRLQVTCPCCGASLLLDPKSGLVLHSQEKQSGYSFEKALEQEKSRKEKSDELFHKAFQNEKQRQDSLEGKFQEALDSQDELDDPVNPMEID